MANWLDFGFFVWNDTIKKGLARGEYAIRIDLIVDGYTVQRTDSSTRIKIPNGEHEFRVEIYFDNGSGVEKYKSQAYMFDATNEDVEFTLTLYYITHGKNNNGFDFAPGIPPLRDKKDRTQGGCYVATCVYGSYDCPEVWTLRRSRYYTLSQTWYGRLFIRTSYTVSPTAVKLFGNTKLFKNIFTPLLNKMIQKLNAQGVENTPYHDKSW